MTDTRPDRPWSPRWSPAPTGPPTLAGPAPTPRPAASSAMPTSPPLAPASSPWPTAPPTVPNPILPPGGTVPPSLPPVPPGGSGSGGTGTGGRRPDGAPRRRGAAAAALAVVAVFAAGIGGVAVGAQLQDGDQAAAPSATTAPSQTVSTVPGPVSSTQTEPVAAVAKAVAPAVVQIETDRGLGSGFIYDKSGLIMTAAHVTDGASQVQVRLADGTRLAGEVVGADDSSDVAVVRVQSGKDLPVAVLATGGAPQVGQTAIAIGSPFGLDQTVTAGIVSAVGRSSQTPGGYIPAIQTDAPINSGNSGGALADRQGRIIGINDSIITGSSNGTQGGGNVGIGFAIPIDLAKTVADLIVEGKPLDGGFLGVEGADASGNQAGASLTLVQQGSPAASAGLQEGDVITEVDGTKVQSMVDLAAAIRTKRPGEDVTLRVLRQGKASTVTVTLGTAPN